MLPKGDSLDGPIHSPPQSQAPNANTAFPSRLPLQKTGCSASGKTPILSAKRPKKRNVVRNSFPTPSITKALPTPEANSNAACQKELGNSLSPMHNVRPVPKLSHHVPTVRSSDSTEDSKDRRYLINGSEQFTEAAGDEFYETEDSSASASWVGRKVDAIFSPVLSFLQGATNSSSSIEADHECAGSVNQVQRDVPPPASEVTSVDVGVILKHGRKNNGSHIVENCCYIDTSNSSGVSKAVPDHFDSIPTMTNTESSGCHSAHIDSDVRMADHCKSLPGAINDEDSCPPSDVYECSEQNNISTTGNNQRPSCADDEEDEFNPYLFIKCLPPYQHAIPPGWSSRPKALPPLDYAVLPPPPPICLVLDLDETLVHCTVEPVANADMIFPVEFNGMEYQVHVRCRPFLQHFLQAVSEKFEVVIFTASQQVYADKLLDKIDPEGKFIHHRMFRDSCLPVEGNFLKDLTILGRDLSKAVLVDNSPHAFGYQVDNGIPIESWFDDPSDKELLKLEMFLRTLHGVNDVRDVVRKTFQTHQLVQNA